MKGQLEAERPQRAVAMEDETFYSYVTYTGRALDSTDIVKNK